jgi:hypothetical protein
MRLTREPWTWESLQQHSPSLARPSLVASCGSLFALGHHLTLLGGSWDTIFNLSSFLSWVRACHDAARARPRLPPVVRTCRCQADAPSVRVGALAWFPFYSCHSQAGPANPQSGRAIALGDCRAARYCAELHGSQIRKREILGSSESGSWPRTGGGRHGATNDVVKKLLTYEACIPRTSFHGRGKRG